LKICLLPENETTNQRKLTLLQVHWTKNHIPLKRCL